MATITFQCESWEQYYKDCQHLWREHYDEIAVDKARMPMSPDTHFFAHLYALGALQVLTARASGVMVGYFLTVVRPHTHYSTVLCGFEDSYFLSKPYRQGLAGVRLIKESERLLKARGVKKVFCMTKTFKDLGLIYQRLGYTHCDSVYGKWIDTNTVTNAVKEGV